MNIEIAPSHRNAAATKDKLVRKKNQKKYLKNIHKCPVNTLLTRIFSAMAWNG